MVKRDYLVFALGFVAAPITYFAVAALFNSFNRVVASS